MEPWTSGPDSGRAASFRALLRCWYGDSVTGEGENCRCSLPCLGDSGRAVELSWLVLGAATQPQPAPSRLARGRWVFRVRLCGDDRRRLNALRAASGPETALLAALAVPPAGWYAVDLSQAGLAGVASELEVPCANRLNAGLASLLWGSRWSHEMGRLLRGQQIRQAAEPDELEALWWVCSCRPELLDPRGGVDLHRLERQARHALDRLRPRDGLIQQDLSAVRYLFYSAFHTIDLCREVRARGPVEGMRVYTGAEINVWLFSRPFRAYLRYTARGVRRPHERYLRMFPTLSRTAGEGKARACSLYQVLQAHRLRGIRASLVEPLREDDYRLSAYVELKEAGSERARLLNLLSRTLYAKRESGSLERDVLDECEQRQCAATGPPGAPGAHFDAPLASEMGLASDEVRLDEAPAALLAPESEFLEHPRELWAGTPASWPGPGPLH